MTKRLHFSGYDFESGPDGTRIVRGTVGRYALSVGMRVGYADVNLRDYAGTVDVVVGQFAMVRWDRWPGFQSKQWVSNLRLLPA